MTYNFSTLITNIVIGFLLIFVFPLIMKIILNNYKKQAIAKSGIGKSAESYWKFVLSWKIFPWAGILWILISIILFIF